MSVHTTDFRFDIKKKEAGEITFTAEHTQKKNR